VLLTSANARRLARRLAEMRGAAMKLGQLLSMEGEHLLPREFAAALAMLRNSADSMPPTQLRRIMGREYGRGWEERFETFDFEPDAAASIGQVHHAISIDGREMALKIQYPGVARSIASDVDNLTLLLKASRLLPPGVELDPLIREAKRQLRQEADYRQEGEFLARYGAQLADEDGFHVPALYEDFTTRHILAMEYSPGSPLEHLGSPGTPQAERDRVGTVLEHLLFRELFEFRLMQSDPNFGNYRYCPSTGTITLLDFGSTVEFTADFVDGYANICRAILAGNDHAVADGAARLGYMRDDDPAEHVAKVVELITLVCEPLTHEGVYDFPASNLLDRARQAGLDLVFQSEHFRSPPPETAFLHRKLVGSFLMCARIGARVRVRDLMTEFVGPV
jgi:predicted unusual protein kinase regulating ubiquinone biosynthesis (AarF/ABC1/UbiB family)